MDKDENFRERLSAARDRQDRFLAGEIQRNVGAESSKMAKDPSGEESAKVVEQVFEPEFGKSMPAVDVDEVPVPEAEEDLAEEEIADLFGDFEDDKDDEPGAKIGMANSNGDVANAGQLGVPKDKKVSWADLAEEEEEELADPKYPARCDHCDLVFENRNSVFKHLKSVGRAHKGEDLNLRSTPSGRRSTDDGCPTRLRKIIQERDQAAGHAETYGSRIKGAGTYDVCGFSHPQE